MDLRVGSGRTVRDAGERHPEMQRLAARGAARPGEAAAEWPRCLRGLSGLQAARQQEPGRFRGLEA